MPKIQLSALATDMKGKSGGSVFARNKGGLYFRNNPSPVQKKSYKWASQKVNFSQVSTKWKSLSEEQRSAWELMTDNYPAKDAWGNTYIPSGFQLYMKLNTTLVSNGLEYITTPLMPQELPVSDEIDLYNPEQEAFTPTRGASLMGYQNRMFYLYAADYLDSADLTLDNHVSARFVRNVNQQYPFRSNARVTLLSMQNDADYGIFAFIQPNSFGKCVLYVAINYQNNGGVGRSLVQQMNVDEAYNSGNMHLTFRFSVDTAVSCRVYVNGFEPEIVETSYYNDTQDSTFQKAFPSGDVISAPVALPIEHFTSPIRVGNFNKTNTPVFMVSDIRYYDADAMGQPCGCSSGTDCPESYDCQDCDCFLVWDDSVAWSEMRYQLLAKGYILGNETAITPLNNYALGVFATYSDVNIPDMRMIDDEDCCSPGSDCADFSDQECQDCCCVYVGDNEWVQPKLPITFSPIAVVTPFTLEESGYYLSVYCTKPIGLGRSDFNSPKILIATIPLDGSTADISSEIAANFPSVKANSKLVISYKLINSATGESIECKPKKPRKNVIRFHAGSELYSSVN